MALDGVPWAIGVGQADGQPGAELPADALRTATYTGTEGVFEPGDFKVTATGTPSNQLQIAAGAARIINRSPGGDRQAYVARNTAAPQAYVQPAATTSGGGRSDLIVCRVEDPQYPPWQGYTDPEAIKHGPYDFFRVLPGVPANTRSARDLTGVYASQSMLALYRLDIPASTAVFTDAMLVDLRQLDRAQEQRRTIILAPPVEDALTQTAWRAWPNWTPTAKVPTWATRATIEGDLKSVGHRSGATAGGLAVQLGAAQSPEVPYDLTSVGGDGERIALGVIGDFDVRAMAGTTQVLKVAGRRDAGEPGNLVTVTGTQLIFRITFYQEIS